MTKRKEADPFNEARQQYDALDRKMRETTVEVTVGGTATVKMNGYKQALEITFNPTGDGCLELFTHLLTHAINQAGHEVDELMKSAVDEALTPTPEPVTKTLH